MFPFKSYICSINGLKKIIFRSKDPPQRLWISHISCFHWNLMPIISNIYSIVNTIPQEFLKKGKNDTFVFLSHAQRQ